MSSAASSYVTSTSSTSTALSSSAKNYDTRILVTNCTTDVGFAIVMELLRQGAFVRGTSRAAKSERGRQLSDCGAQIVQLEDADSEGWRKYAAAAADNRYKMCTKDMDIIVIATPFLCVSADSTRWWCKAVAGSPTVRRIVRVAGPCNDFESPFLPEFHGEATAAIEAAIEGTSIDFSELRTPIVLQSYAKLLAPTLHTLSKKLTQATSFGGLVFSFVDADDVASLTVKMVFAETMERKQLRGAMSVTHLRVLRLLANQCDFFDDNAAALVTVDDFVPKGTTARFLSDIIRHARENPWSWAATDNGHFEQRVGRPLNSFGLGVEDSPKGLHSPHLSPSQFSKEKVSIYK